jgi:hypothetical protein
MTLRWEDPAWLSDAHTWIEARLAELDVARAGVIEQPHIRRWSTVLRVPTDAGTLWFKANDVSLRHEARLVDLLAGFRPDCILKPLAIDAGSGWMLMSDAGEPLGKLAPVERNLDRWLDVLARYAQVQLDVTDAVDTLLAVGVPDMRLAVLPEKYEQLMEEIGAEQRFREATAHVAALCRVLGDFGVAETIQHDDLHDGQVFVRDGRHLLMDWADACISHPFFTLSVTLEGMLAWGIDDIENSLDTTPFRDAYLAPFTQRYGGDLVRASDLAIRLGWACRAVNGHVPGDLEPTYARLRMFLDGRP